MKTQILQLDEHDDVISARDKMAWSKAPRLLLVWPKRVKLLERSVDLLVLQRYGQSLGAQVGIVTNSASIRDQARELGIPCFSKPAQAQRQAWRRGRGRKRFNPRLQVSKSSAELLRAQFTAVQAQRAVSDGPQWARISAFSLGVAAVFVLALLFWPSASIRLVPAQREQRLELDLRASTAIPAVNASGGVPAQEVNVVVEGSDQERSSGTVTVPGARARGMVQITNLSELEQVIPAGTVLSTAEDPPARYETLRDASLAAGVGSVAQVEVQAMLPGAGSNAPAGAIRAMEGAQGLSVAVGQQEPLSGGTDQTSPGPTPADYVLLRERLLESLRKTAVEDFYRSAGGEQRLLESSVTVKELLSETMSPPSGEPGDVARMSMRVEFRAFIVREEDLQTVARAAFEANRVEGFSPEPGPAEIQFITAPVLGEDGSYTLTAAVKRDLRSIIDPERTARSVVGMKPEAASAMLERSNILAEPVEIRLFPSWWFRLPFLSFRVQVEGE